MQHLYSEAMQLALAKAGQFWGATMPNPAVGAAALDELGNILAVTAHERAGEPHAEVHALRAFAEMDPPEPPHTLVVTLEPCNHSGKTPPCTEAILRAGVRRVVFGARDPNPLVAGGGAERLRSAGVEVIEGVELEECERLIAGFASRLTKQRPYVTVKRAKDLSGSMLPPPGQKTFTSSEALRFAHRIRRRSDAIVTGSGTILADNPSFTVRHLPDYRLIPRFLVVLDRRGRVSQAWYEQARKNNFELVPAKSYEHALEELAALGAMEVLVEAGPELSTSILSTGLWDELVDVHQGVPAKIHTFHPSPQADLGPRLVHEAFV